MAYSAPFWRLVLIGDLYTDVFNTTLSLVPSGGSAPAVTQADADALATAITTFWAQDTTGGGWNITASARLTGWKLNRIGTDGRYMDPGTIEHVLPSPVAGGGPIGAAPQLAQAATIRGANERAAAGRGRMFFPVSAYGMSVESDGRISSAEAGVLAQIFHGFLQNIDGVLIDRSIPLLAGIASKTGAGAFQVMSRVSVGRTVDTIRSRRNRLPEAAEYYPV
jgi:hypothetical protein